MCADEAGTAEVATAAGSDGDGLRDRLQFLERWPAGHAAPAETRSRSSSCSLAARLRG